MACVIFKVAGLAVAISRTHARKFIIGIDENFSVGRNEKKITSIFCSHSVNIQLKKKLNGTALDDV